MRGVFMQNHLRQLTRKGDPIMRVRLPKLACRLLASTAKSNKRRIQDEFIKRIAASLIHEHSQTDLQQAIINKLKIIY